MTMHIREPAADTIVVERQLLMIEPEKVKGCSVEIVNGHRLLGWMESQIIGDTIGESRLETAPAIQQVKHSGLWSRPAVVPLPCETAVRPNSVTPITSVSFSKPRASRSWSSPATG